MDDSTREFFAVLAQNLRRQAEGKSGQFSRSYAAQYSFVVCHDIASAIESTLEQTESRRRNDAGPDDERP